MSWALEKVRDEGEKGHKKQVSSFFVFFAKQMETSSVHGGEF